MALVGADEEVRQAVGAAEESELAVVVEAALGLVDCGLDGERGRRVGRVLLERGGELLDGLLLALGEGLGVLAGCEARDVGGGGGWGCGRRGEEH